MSFDIYKIPDKHTTFVCCNARVFLSVSNIVNTYDRSHIDAAFDRLTFI